MRAIDRPWKRPRRFVLDNELDILVRRHGYQAVESSLKRHSRPGRPRGSEVELRYLIGKSDALALIGAQERKSPTALKKSWAAVAPDNQRSTYLTQADRVLPEREVLGLAIAVNEHWQELDLSKRRYLLHAARELAVKADASFESRLIDELLQGEPHQLEEKPPSRGLVRDDAGLPRFKPEMEHIAEWLLDQAFPFGRESQN